ncbi:Alpha/Beta hydrolase protein [Helicostylum pulchrum]|nr:Alpha/Beta hydrolase protein [Helicostylum pulchrum]
MFHLLAVSFTFLLFFQRTLVLQKFRDGLHLIPISIRRFALASSWILPVVLNRLILYVGTSPIGNENQWLQRVKKSTWEGVWIGSNLNSLKQAEKIALNQDVILFYIHGGGFSMGQATMYMQSFQLIIETLHKVYGKKASILSLEYSLSPEQVWPKACYESVDGYRYLIHELGIESSKVVFIGDSAGGNLVASTLLILKEQRSNEQLKELAPLPLPAGAALISPWIDLTPVQATCQSDTLSMNLLSQCLSQYLADQSMIHHPYVSPFYGDFSSLTCPLFISYGEHELLRTSIEQFISNLKESGNNPTVLKGENESHIWLISSIMATSRQVYDKDINALTKWISGNVINFEPK